MNTNQIEQKLRELWAQYIEHQDKYGLNETTRLLKEKYFALYRSYRRDKNWRQIVSNQ